MRNFTTTTKGWLLALALMASTAATQAQTTVFSENFDGFSGGKTGSGALATDINTSLNDYTSTAGWSGSKVYQAGGTIKMGTSSTQGYIQLPAIDLSANNGAFTINFKSMAWEKDATDLIITVNGTTTTVSGLTNTAEYTLTPFSIDLTGGTASTVIKFSGKQASKGRFFLEDLSIVQNTNTNTTTPNVTCASSMDAGTILTGQTQQTTLNIKATNLTGDLTVSLSSSVFSIVNTTIDQSAAQSNEGFDLPVTFAPNAKGAHTATLTLSGGGLTQDVNVTLSGNAYEVKNMASVSALRNEWTGTEDQYTRYLLEGQALVTYASGKNMYVQDNHAGILIYDKNSDIAPAGAALGDLISGMTGTLKLYGGLLELEINQPGLTIHSNANAVSPLEITADEFVNNFASYESRLVRIQNVSFTTADGTSAFTAKAQNLDVTCGDRSFVVRTMAGAGFESHTIPGKAHVTGLAIQYNGTLQLSPRTPGDLNTTLMGIDTQNNTANIEVINGAIVAEGITGTLSIYNMQGHLVRTTPADGQRVTIELPHGIYIVKTHLNTLRFVL